MSHSAAGEVRLATHNVAGNSFITVSAEARGDLRRRFNSELASWIARHQPHVVLLQEIVQYQESEDHPMVHLVEPPDGYYYRPSIILDSGTSATGHHPKKWAPIRQAGGWDERARFGQGNGLLFRRDLLHAPLWDVSRSAARVGPDLDCEEVALDSGLFTGDRDTEPRRATVARFIVDGFNVIFCNTHLSTLKRERECFPERDAAGSALRSAQVQLILNGIVSRWNEFRASQPSYEHGDRAIFILGGDLNATPLSPELASIRRFFVDLNPDKGNGTKRSRSGSGMHDGLVVDYLLAGVCHHSLDPERVEMHARASSPPPLEEVELSDHRPLVASVPLPPWPAPRTAAT